MRTLLALPLALALAACADDATPEPTATPDPTPAAPAAGLVADGAYARSAPAGGVSAVYLTLQNGTSAADTLLAAVTVAAGRVEIHQTQDVGDGLSGMVPVEGGLAVPAGGTVTMEPGGLHVMLLDLQRELAAGDTLDVELQFSSGDRRTVRAPVRAPGA